MTVAHMKHSPFPWTPLPSSHPNLTAGRVVHILWHPEQRLVISIYWRRGVAPKFRFKFRPILRATWISLKLLPVSPLELQHLVSRRCHPIKAPLLNDVQAVRGHPMPLIIAATQDVLRPHAQTVGRAQTSGECLQLRSILRNPNHCPLMRTRVRWCPRRPFSEIKIARTIRLQIERKFVVVFRHHTVIVKVLVIIHLPIPIQIMQTRNLIAPSNIDFSINHLTPQRLEETGRHSLPRDLLQFRIQPADHPNIPTDIHNRRISVRQKIVPTKAQPRRIGIRIWRSDFVDHIRTSIRPNFPLRNHRSPPMSGPTLAPPTKIRQDLRLNLHIRQSNSTRSHYHPKCTRRFARRKPHHRLPIRRLL